MRELYLRIDLKKKQLKNILSDSFAFNEWCEYFMRCLRAIWSLLKLCQRILYIFEPFSLWRGVKNILTLVIHSMFALFALNFFDLETHQICIFLIVDETNKKKLTIWNSNKKWTYLTFDFCFPLRLCVCAIDSIHSAAVLDLSHLNFGRTRQMHGFHLTIRMFVVRTSYSHLIRRRSLYCTKFLFVDDINYKLIINFCSTSTCGSGRYWPLRLSLF